MRARIDVLREILVIEQRILDRCIEADCADVIDRQWVVVLQAELEVLDEQTPRAEPT